MTLNSGITLAIVFFIAIVAGVRGEHDKVVEPEARLGSAGCAWLPAFDGGYMREFIRLHSVGASFLGSCIALARHDRRRVIRWKILSLEGFATYSALGDRQYPHDFVRHGC